MTLRYKHYWLWMPLLACAACAVGPDYERPSVEIPAAYKEAGTWTPAAPKDEADRGAWWSIYHDTLLDELEKQVDISNQNLKSYEAAWRAAKAAVDESGASLFPTLSLDGSGTRSGKGSPSTAKNAISSNASAAWDIDVWGRIRRGVEGDEASAEASAADLASARLSAQADLATNYFNLRIQDELIRTLNATVRADSEALKIAKNKYEAGLVAKTDVLSAETSLQTAQSSIITAQIKRAQLEHAIAVLIGKAPATYSLTPSLYKANTPTIPVAVPSTLLERRPDIAAAERRVTAANAQIGVKTAAWYPSLSLSASYGYSAQLFSKLIQASNSLWSVGPTVAATLFDGGARSASIRGAEASYDQAVADYRQTVLTAFKDVEDELVALSSLTRQEHIEKAALDAARASLKLTMNQYKAGTIDYNSILVAQTTALAREQSALTVTANKLTASVSLIRAMGGGWNDQTKELTSRHE